MAVKDIEKYGVRSGRTIREDGLVVNPAEAFCLCTNATRTIPAEDSQIFVTTLGLMGEKYVEISAGSKGAPFVKPGSTMVGANPSSMQDLMDNANGMITDNRKTVKSAVEYLNLTAKNFSEFSDDIKKNPWKLLFRGKEKKR